MKHGYTSLVLAASLGLGAALTTPHEQFYHTNQAAPKPKSNAVPHYKDFANSAYRLVDSYDASNFFDSFNFYTGGDPTHGFVNYLNRNDAQNSGLINTNNGQIYMGVDHTTQYPNNGRASVRVGSNKGYTKGLYIADIAHMPSSACGSWPAFWTFGPNWPYNGEIDIIEGVNQANGDTITLHTSPGCVIDNAGSQGSTRTLGTNCNDGNGNVGCGVSSGAAYGDSFNNGGGGVYAMQWESSGVYVWFFPRNSIPADISSGNPRTQNWGTPTVAFNGGSQCNIDQHFANHNIIFDTTFCGDWAGAVWSSGSCASQANSCQDYVSANPGAFSNSYWLINSVKVYQLA